MTQFLSFDADARFAARESLPHQLERHIQGDIIRLRLAPGSKLVEEDLCRAFQVSRSPIREALNGIEGSGLAIRLPRRGVHVAPMTMRNLDELYDCRVPLEGLAAFHAAGRRSDDQLARMRALLREMAEGQRDGKSEKLFEANVQLTDVLHEASHSTVLRSQLGQLDRQALRYRYYCYLRDAQIVEDDLAANTRLIDRIEAGDAKAAQATTEALVRHSWDVVRSVMQAHDPDGLPPAAPEEKPAQDLQSRSLTERFGKSS